MDDAGRRGALLMDLLLDARAWLARGRGHLQTYNEIAGGRDRAIWRIEYADKLDGSMAYALLFDRARLDELKIVTAEAASALFQALDHVVAAGARAALVPRHHQILWPFKLESDEASELPSRLLPNIKRGLAVLEKQGVPALWRELISETYAAHPLALPQIDAVKQVSNSGKHWELVPTDGEALAVVWHTPGAARQTIRQIPLGHFICENHYVFHEGELIPAENFEMVMRFRFKFADQVQRIEPATAMAATARFVDTAIDKAQALLEPVA